MQKILVFYIALPQESALVSCLAKVKGWNPRFWAKKRHRNMAAPAVGLRLGALLAGWPDLRAKNDQWPILVLGCLPSFLDYPLLAGPRSGSAAGLQMIIGARGLPSRRLAVSALPA